MRRLGLALMVLALGACSETRVDLRIELAPAVGASALRIVVENEAGEEVYREQRAAEETTGSFLPVFADSSDVFAFEAVALSETDDPIATVRGRVHAVAGEHREVHVRMCEDGVCEGPRCFSSPARPGQGPSPGEACPVSLRCTDMPRGALCDDGNGVCAEGRCCWCFDSEGRCIGASELDTTACGSGGRVCAECCDADSCDAGVCVAALPFETVGAGESHVCASTVEGDVFCWGGDAMGQLGLGPGDQSTATPTFVGRLGRVSVGSSHTCALGDRLRCWGANEQGESGATTGVPFVDAPNEVAGAWSRVSAGYDYTCGSRMDGTLLCFGANDANQLGNETYLPGPAPREVRLPVPLRTFATARQSIAIGEDGFVYGWGLQVNSGGFQSCSPQPEGCVRRAHEPAVGGWQEIASGSFFACGVNRDDELDCWGDYLPDVFGTMPGDFFQEIYERVEHPLGRRFLSLEAAQALCALDNRGDAWCWVADLVSLDDVATPRPVPFAQAWRELGTHKWRTACAINEGGALYCWGAGSDGQLGVGGLFQSPRPVPICIPR